MKPIPKIVKEHCLEVVVPCCELPSTLLEQLFNYFDFTSLLAARRVSREWNAIIMDRLLPPKTTFHVLPNPKCEFWKKQLRKPSNLLPYLSGDWKSLHVHHLEVSGPLWKSYINLEIVTHLTLYQSQFTIPQLVCKTLANMPALHFLNITEGLVTGDPAPFPITYSNSLAIFGSFFSSRKSWTAGLETLQRLETFKIQIHRWTSSLIYLKLITSAGKGNLKKLSLDFSKLVNLPLTSPRIEDTYGHVADIVSNNAATLQELRIKWSHRVETDDDLSRYDEEQDYFLYFLDVLGSPKWPSSEILQLRILELGFPHVNFQSPMVDLAFIPFLKRQTHLTRLFLSRVQYSQQFYRFNMKFLRYPKMRREYGIQVRDLDPTLSAIPFQSQLTSVEIRIYWSTKFYVTFQPLARHLIFTSDWQVTRPARHVMSLRIYNSRLNVYFLSFNVPEITSTFPNLRLLELLDEVGPDDPLVESTVTFDRHLNRSEITDKDFQLIALRLPYLVSLKLSSLHRLTDAGLTGVSPIAIARMKKSGNYYAEEEETPLAPMLARMRHLKYLELRNLSERVTDVSVFYGFQYIPNLEKIAFHGNHKITSWGTKVLETKFKSNPRFTIFMKKYAWMPFYNDFP